MREGGIEREIPGGRGARRDMGGSERVERHRTTGRGARWRASTEERRPPVLYSLRSSP